MERMFHLFSTSLAAGWQHAAHTRNTTSSLSCPIYLLLLAVALLSVPSRTFAQLELNYQLEEEVQSGMFVADIFKDANLVNLYTQEELRLIYFRFLKDEPMLNFTVSNRTAMIRTRGRLDRERVCAYSARCSLRLDVAVQPVQYLKIIKVTLELIDINDNSPRFPQSVITHSILESTVIGSEFTIPSADDPDSPRFSVERYLLQPPNRKFSLVLSQKLDGSKEIQLVVNTSLDRETVQGYTFQVVAYDGGIPPRSGSVELQIDLLDANDNHPVFDQMTYEVEIRENLPRGTTILQVHASDPDSGNNGLVNYGFSERTASSYAELFRIDHETGDIVITGDVDYESHTVYHLAVTAQDSGPDSVPGDATVIIKVTDINDHAPEITVSTLPPSSGDIAEVEEGSPIGTFVAYISVVDKDSGHNAQFNCTLSDPNFQLSYLYDGEYQLVTLDRLDRERQSRYTVAVICTDHGREPQISRKTINIDVKDVNDHEPVFSKKLYTAELIENNYIGAEVTTVSAVDSDLGKNSEVTYSLANHMRKYFSIDPKTGVITAQKSIDREETDQLRFYVFASDNGREKKTASVLVIVDIQDVNDQVPTFTRNSYSFSVDENMPSGTRVGMVSAEDGDGIQFSQLTYSFLPTHSMSEAFRIDPSTGLITTAKVLDRELLSRYYLMVLAQDNGSPALSNSCSVTIHVTDQNDNAPVFDYPTEYNNTINLSGKVPPDYVVTKVTAHDLDIGENGQITYEIESGNADKVFIIDPTFGTIIVNKDLSKLDDKAYELRIAAKDGGIPPNMTFANFNIIVNKSVPFPIAAGHHGLLSGQNFTIVISLACVSAVIMVVLVLAIVFVKRQDLDRQTRKYNCRMQALKMLAGEKAPNGKNSTDAHKHCNGTATPKQNGSPTSKPVSGDTCVYTEQTYCPATQRAVASPHLAKSRNTRSQEMWPTMPPSSQYHQQVSYMGSVVVN